ncbi:MAG: glucosaminidase domain-containing protein [Chloroflexi bacterium]|uniref:Glucosaminidase domain-containing protein n=1 Tax=Candidatus Chlorohelix allophototropha TaxID=3003348 RepID=A0A8T7LZ65_9CHLR|nr:glucosaminidase domain-containing protein [Chloroflexota bacterium]WJW65734.1 hypothetical protein OZ401_001512 [Chloroflexota bacterium L227-S17]
MLQRPIPNNEYEKALHILQELEKGDRREGLFSCFAISRRGEVIWFDEVGSPYGVAIQGSALVKTRVLNLPSQPMRVVNLEEAYQQLIQQQQRQYLTVLATLSYGSKQERGILASLALLIGFIIGLLALYMLLRPYTSNESNVSIAGVGDVTIVSTGSYNPIADPTVTRTNFKAFLKEMNSPALSEADQMYDACLKEGCDPALMLAFFEHESSGGNQGVAAITRSVGNIRCTPGYNCYQTSTNGSFRLYANWAEGVVDWARLLKQYRDNGARTLDQIIPVYAPQEDNNDVNGYINAVKQRVDDLRKRELKLR